ncbi:hypothetical protein CYMTET_26951 [Cymbomonas tetramitiformis]|uniref:Uncharacterized protein n=1 Tax=Cymbomonas tetramitiformis TaxID=36881 RepID=A0AAE0FRF4_9CHLO|nr:hypothetical protein CYMTET_26951 [Cymbomonas tetramitiformis]
MASPHTGAAESGWQDRGREDIAASSARGDGAQCGAAAAASGRGYPPAVPGLGFGFVGFAMEAEAHKSGLPVELDRQKGRQPPRHGGTDGPLVGGAAADGAPGALGGLEGCSM